MSVPAGVFKAVSGFYLFFQAGEREGGGGKGGGRVEYWVEMKRNEGAGIKTDGERDKNGADVGAFSPLHNER